MATTFVLLVSQKFKRRRDWLRTEKQKAWLVVKNQTKTRTTKNRDVRFASLQPLSHLLHSSRGILSPTFRFVPIALLLTLFQVKCLECDWCGSVKEFKLHLQDANGCPNEVLVSVQSARVEFVSVFGLFVVGLLVSFSWSAAEVELSVKGRVMTLN